MEKGPVTLEITGRGCLAVSHATAAMQREEIIILEEAITRYKLGLKID